MMDLAIHFPFLESFGAPRVLAVAGTEDRRRAWMLIVLLGAIGISAGLGLDVAIGMPAPYDALPLAR